MTRHHSNMKLTLPLLQRFIDGQQKSSQMRADFECLHEDIRLNLQLLLNSHLSFLHWPAHYHHLDDSMWNYGIADFSHYRYNDEAGQQQLCMMIKSAVERFEPRLNQVNVVLMEGDHEMERVLQIRIEGVINLATLSESAVFESRLDLTHQQFEME